MLVVGLTISRPVVVEIRALDAAVKVSKSTRCMLIYQSIRRAGGGHGHSCGQAGSLGSCLISGQEGREKDVAGRHRFASWYITQASRACKVLKRRNDWKNPRGVINAPRMRGKWTHNRVGVPILSRLNEIDIPDFR